MLENRIKEDKVSSSLNNLLLSKERVYKKLCPLKNNKAYENDGMLKELVNELKGVLTIIYNRSMSESKVPKD